MGRGKNALKNLYIHKVLSLIDAELELLNLKIKHPEQFNLPVHAEFKSDLYVIPKSKDLGIIGIAEIVIGLFLQGEITGKNGKPVSEACLAVASSSFSISNLVVSMIRLMRYLIGRRAILLKH